MVATSGHSRRRRWSPAMYSAAGQTILQTLNLYMQAPITSIEGPIEVRDLKETVKGGYQPSRQLMAYFWSPAMMTLQWNQQVVANTACPALQTEIIQVRAQYRQRRIENGSTDKWFR